MSKRYCMCIADSDGGWTTVPVLDDDGDWVCYEDHAAELSRLRTRIADLERCNAELQSLDTLQQKRIEELEAAGRLLGAECKAWQTWCYNKSNTKKCKALAIAKANRYAHPTAAGFVKEPT